MHPSRDESRRARTDPARLVVWESEGVWARELRRLLSPGGPRVFEARTPRACREIVAGSPASLVVAQWTTATSAELIGLVTQFDRECPATRTIAVADGAVESSRWQVFETGIIWLCTSPRRLGPVVAMIRRHFDQVPKPSQTLEQRIWDELPWPT